MEEPKPKAASPRYNLTFANVESLKPPQTGRITVLDAKTPGLHLVCTSFGTKSYYLYRRVQGKPVRVLLGHHPKMIPDHAREAAIRAYAEQLAGVNQNEEKHVERLGGTTLGEVWAKYLADRLEPRSAASTVVAHTSRWTTCLDVWASRRLDSITRAEVSGLHAMLGRDRGHTSANRAVQLLRALYNYADTALGIELRNPAAKIEMFREQPRERFLKADEVPKLFAALDAESDPILRDFFYMALWTGQRRGNVQSMAWDDIDLVAKTWTIPAASFKTRRALTVALSAEALEVLTRRAAAPQINRFVFPSYGKRGHIVEPKAAWKRILDRSGLKDLTIHDLRRTLGSWQAAAGASLPIIGKSLGHTQTSTTAIYARLDLAAVRESVEAATAALKAAGEKKEEKPLEA